MKHALRVETDLRNLPRVVSVCGRFGPIIFSNAQHHFVVQDEFKRRGFLGEFIPEIPEDTYAWNNFFNKINCEECEKLIKDEQI